MKILNKSAPNIEPCGIPQLISDQLLYDKAGFALCFLKHK